MQDKEKQILTKAVSDANKLSAEVRDLEKYSERLHIALDNVLILLLITNGYNYDYNAIDQALELLYEGFEQGQPLTTSLAEKIRGYHAR